jgi:hypothetical protein
MSPLAVAWMAKRMCSGANHCKAPRDWRRMHDICRSGASLCGSG